MKYFLALILYLAVVSVANSSEVSLADYCGEFFKAKRDEVMELSQMAPGELNSHEKQTMIETYEQCKLYLEILVSYKSMKRKAGANVPISASDWRDDVESAPDEDSKFEQKRLKSLKSRIGKLEADLVGLLMLEEKQEDILLEVLRDPESDFNNLTIDLISVEAEDGYFIKGEITTGFGAPKFLIIGRGKAGWYSVGDVVDGLKLARKNDFLYVGNNRVQTWEE